MNVNGVMKTDVSVEVTNDELFRCLCRELGYEYESIFYLEYGTRWVCRDNKLYEQSDISYHGSPSYEDTGKVIKDMELYNSLKCIKDKLLNKKGRN